MYIGLAPATRPADALGRVVLPAALSEGLLFSLFCCFLRFVTLLLLYIVFAVVFCDSDSMIVVVLFVIVVAAHFVIVGVCCCY